MKQRRNLIKLLFDRERIEFNTRYFFKLAFLFLTSVLTLTVFVSYLEAIALDLNYITISMIGLLWVTAITTTFTFFNRLTSISIKGDMVIFKSLRGKNDVSNIQSVRSVTTYHLMNTRITFVHYRLDGTTKRVICVTHSRNLISSPENTFRKALEISERIKERANHKPGSVLQPESECLSFI